MAVPETVVTVELRMLILESTAASADEYESAEEVMPEFFTVTTEFSAFITVPFFAKAAESSTLLKSRTPRST